MVLPVVLLLSAAGTSASAAPGPRDGKGRFGIRLIEAPVARRNDPRALTGIVDHLSPGTTIRRRVEVTNVSPERLRVKVYAAAASIQKNRFAFAAGRTANELSGWTSAEHSVLDVPPHGKRITRITIRVPRTASRGERYGVIWGQAEARPDARHNVGVVTRVGIPIYLDVGAGGEPPSDMRVEALVPARTADGRPQIIAHVRNTGGRALVISGSLSLSDGPGGLRAGPYPADLGVTLLPGGRAPVTVALDQRLPNGPWKARLTLRSGMVERKVSATLTFPSSGTGDPVTPASATWLYALLAVAAAVLLAGPAFLLRRRRVLAAARG